MRVPKDYSQTRGIDHLRYTREGVSRLKKHLRLLALLLTLAMILMAACSTGKDTKDPKGSDTKAPTAPEVKKGPNGEIYGGTYRVSLSEEPAGLDPQIDTTLSVYTLSRDIFSTLVRFKGNTMELEPELLTEMPKADAESKKFTFKLRSDVTFHNGAKLTAKDVKYTFERMLTPATKAKNGWVLEEIDGAKDMLASKATELKGFKIVDDYNFEITLARPFSAFPQLLATPPASIFPAEYTKQQGDKFQRAPIGSGPFKLTKWETQQQLVFEKNENYFEKGLPYLDKLEYRIIKDESTRWLEFEKGTFDTAVPPTAEFVNAKTSGKFTFLEYPTLNTFYLSVNLDVFKDKRVREAMSLGIDRAKICKTVRNDNCVPAKAFTTPGVPGALTSAPELKFDPAKAKELLKAAGATNLKVESWQRGTAKVSDDNLAIQQMMKDIGLNWEVKMYDNAAFRDARGKGTIPANFGNWYADYGDPDNYLYTYFHSTSTMSVNLKDKDVDKILDEARGLPDQAKRLKMYQDLETKLVLQEYMIIPVFHLKGYAVIQKWVHGMKGHPTEVESHKLLWKDAGK